MPKVTQQAPKPAPRKGSALSVIDRIETLSTDGDGIKVSLYGRSGTGKTTLWATFPGPILAIICSSLSTPGELRSIDTPEYRKKIKKVVLKSSDEIRTLSEHLQAHPNLFSTVVLDHATGLADLNLKEILGISELPPQLSWGLASQQQYGQLALQMKEKLRALLDLPTNVVIVAQERNFNDDSGDSELLAPTVGSALTPSVVGWLNPACDYVVQTFITRKMKTVKTTINGKEITSKQPDKGVEFCLRTAPDPVYTTKFRVPKGHVLPDVIVDPTYDKIIKTIRGE